MSSERLASIEAVIQAVIIEDYPIELTALETEIAELITDAG